jgi:transposase
MNYSYFCGCDVSKNHIDFCLLDQQDHIYLECRSKNTIPELIKALSTLPVGIGRVLLCAEHTGMYGYNLRSAAADLSIPLWVEHPAQINASLALKRGKSDPLDAERIARYAFRNRDKARLVKPAGQPLQKLKYLQSERTLLVADRAKYKGQLRDQKAHMPAEVWNPKSLRLQTLIGAFSDQIKQIDKAIAELVQADSVIGNQYQLLQSIPGVGPRLSLAVIVATNGFADFTCPRAFSCYCGVAPFVWHSGRNTYSRARVSHRADKRIKSLLHMGALSAINCPGELKEYYLRKTEEGKAKMSVVNAVRSKLIHRMFAVIKKGQKYSPVLQQKIA